MPQPRKYATRQEQQREASRRRREREGTGPKRTADQLERNRQLQQDRDRRRRGGGKSGGQRPGDLARLAARASAAMPAVERTAPKLSRETKQAVALCRRERAKREKRDARAIAEAKAEFEALLANKPNFRTGRPAKRPGLSLRSDPANALVSALSTWSGE